MRRGIHLTLLAVALTLFGSGCDEDGPAPTPTPDPTPDPDPDPAAPPEVTAADVTDRDSVQAFVEEAVAAIEAGAPADGAVYDFLDATFRSEVWHVGDIYIFVLDPDGNSVFNAGNPTLEGTDVSGLVDLNGVEIVVDLIAVAGDGGGFVEYWFDNPEIEGDEEHGSPKVGYATTVEAGGATWVVGSGVYPKATAAEVTDRATLKTFVDLAHSVVLAGVSDPDEVYHFLDTTFRPEGDWRDKEIYLFAINSDGTGLFHAVDTSAEGQDRSDLVIDGVRVTVELLKAAQDGGGYVEYRYDNPETATTDPEPKISYSVLVTIGDREFALGAGFYPDPS